MSRLLTIVNERRKLRNEYRKYLEDNYIALKKEEEKKESVQKIMELREKGIETPPTEDEIKEIIKKREAYKKEKIEKKLGELKEIT